LASLFYKVCKDKDCIHFHGPVIKQVDGKIFEYENKCFKYDAVPVTCNEDKKTLSFAENFNIGKLSSEKQPKAFLNNSE